MQITLSLSMQNNLIPRLLWWWPHSLLPIPDFVSLLYSLVPRLLCAQELGNDANCFGEKLQDKMKSLGSRLVVPFSGPMQNCTQFVQNGVGTGYHRIGLYFLGRMAWEMMVFQSLLYFFGQWPEEAGHSHDIVSLALAMLSCFCMQPGYEVDVIVCSS